jgi:hypothetical protein
MIVFVPTMILTVYTMAKSQRWFEFIDAVANETMSLGEKLRALHRLWRAGPRT